MVCFFFQFKALATNAPGTLVVTGASSSQINLSWSDNSSNETGFTFAYDTNSGLTSPTYVYAGGANTTSYSHTGRSPATTYYYKIKAEGNPDSAWSSVENATTAPSGLTAAATSNSVINLIWTGNGSNAAIHGYTYACAANSSFTGATYNWVANNDSSSASKTGLSTATTYWFKIRAEGTSSDAFDSPYGTVVTTTTTPASLAASVVSSSQINLSWTGNSGNSNIQGYTIAYATNSSFSGAVYQYVNGAGATSFNNTGLYAGMTYYYKIKAEGTSDAYDSAFTAYITATTTGTAPNAPSGLSASAVSSSQINLSWTDNSNNETGFEIKRATDSGFTQNVIWVGNIQGTTYSNTGLSPSTTYYYKVRAEGATQDSVYSSSVSATTNQSVEPPPTAPSGLSATAVSGTLVNLSWTDNSNNETGFEIKRATDSGFTQNVVWIGNIQGTTYANTGLNPSTTYYYMVRAEGVGGKSAYSASMSVTTGVTPPPPPTGVPISLHFAGINAWMPSQIGAHKYNGKLGSKWEDVQASGVRIMRYGGHGVDVDADPILDITKDQYVAMVEAMKANGIEPVLQVPVNGRRYSAEQAADIVTYVNITKGKHVKYWIIGNEPNLPGGGYDYTSAQQVASYIKPFASAMKAVDPSIKIIGPETAWYDSYIIDGLTSCTGNPATDAYSIMGKDSNGHYYVDIFSFHTYNGFDGSQSRSQVISTLMSSAGFNNRLGTLKSNLATCNSYHGRTGENALQMAITEANVNYTQPPNDGLSGVGSGSFIGGQFWAELMGIAMQQGVDFVTFWSTIEGGPPDHLDSENGYFSGDGTIKRPSYYHFQMMAQNFRGYSVTATDTVTATGNNQPNVKTFASQDVDQIVVMIMNQEQSSSFDYTVRLNTGAVSGTKPLKINVDAGVAVQYDETISPESSVVLIFDAYGTIKKKIEYKLYGNATSNLPPTVTNY
ncbi:MAG TPA: fibronectin type III domain-containing protein [Pyrinomonadaceae bacterium]